MDTRPIGMFDSGCGGLTVLKEYMKLLPNEDFIYYGDTAHLPYGDKSPETIKSYSEEIVKFLIDQNVKMIIIACGTASATAYEYLKGKFNIEIRNIIEPTIKNINDKNIGVIATKSTIKSKAWETGILKYNPNANIKSIACPLFVPLIEEGFIDTPATNYVVDEYMKQFTLDSDVEISSLILGCTHYPLLQEKLKEVLDKNIKIINVGEYSAKDTLSYLKDNNMQNDASHNGVNKYYSSDDFELFKEMANKLGFEIN